MSDTEDEPTNGEGTGRSKRKQGGAKTSNNNETKKNYSEPADKKRKDNNAAAKKGAAVSTTATPKRQQKKRVLLGVTGSVAAVKAPEIAVTLCRQLDVEVKILLTRGALNFWEQSKTYNQHWWGELQQELGKSGKEGDNKEEEEEERKNKEEGKDGSTPRIVVLYSEDEWRSWNQLGDPIMHIDLRTWADCLVLAPLSAHTLAKLASGLCDDALSSVARAWDFGKPMVLAPAMNTYMWEHPLTQRQLETIRGFFASHARRIHQPSAQLLCNIVLPQVKTLACGDVGDGALANVSNIVEAVKTTIHLEMSSAAAQVSHSTQRPLHGPPPPPLQPFPPPIPPHPVIPYYGNAPPPFALPAVPPYPPPGSSVSTDQAPATSASAAAAKKESKDTARKKTDIPTYPQLTLQQIEDGIQKQLRLWCKEWGVSSHGLKHELQSRLKRTLGFIKNEEHV